jgi:hypothetical protein
MYTITGKIVGSQKKARDCETETIANFAYGYDIIREAALRTQGVQPFASKRGALLLHFTAHGTTIISLSRL